MKRRALWSLVGCVSIGLGGCASSPRPASWAALQSAPKRPADGEFRSGLRLRCEPGDATVYVNGVPKGLCEDFGRTPMQVRGEGAMHLLEVKKEGFAPYLTYYAPSGAIVTLTVKLEPRAHAGRTP